MANTGANYSPYPESAAPLHLGQALLVRAANQMFAPHLRQSRVSLYKMRNAFWSFTHRGTQSFSDDVQCRPSTFVVRVIL